FCAKSSLEAEVAAYIERFKQERDVADHALVVRNGKAQERPLSTGAGGLNIKAPRIKDKRECIAMVERSHHRPPLF
ncbi:MAG: putative transposase, partial [Candidatus Promineifilaceae bacterium]